MGAPTISRPMWQGPSSRAEAGSLPNCRTAFSMLSLQRWKPTRSPRQAVQVRFEGGMRMPLPCSTTNPLASVKDSSMPHQRRTVSRILRTIWSSSRRAESMGMVSTQLLLQRRKAEFGNFRNGAGTVDGNHRGKRADQAAVLALDGQELAGGLVALELGAAHAHPFEGDAGRDVEEEGQVGTAGEAVGRLDELVRDGGALVGQRAQGISVEDHVFSPQ